MLRCPASVTANTWTSNVSPEYGATAEFTPLVHQVKSYLLDLQWQAPMRAVKFDSWMTAKKARLLQGAEISSNEWVANADKFRLPKMLGLQVCQSGLLCSVWIWSQVGVSMR